MNMKRKFIGILGALALSMSMTGGIANAEDISIPDPNPDTVQITVTCGPQNLIPPTVQLVANGDVNFEALDPNDAAQLQSRSMGPGTLRVVANVDYCQAPDWSVQASITNFTSGTNVIPGTHFQLPIGSPDSSATAMKMSDNTVVSNVVAPDASVVTFASSGATNVGSTSIMRAEGQAYGSMYMDFTGKLVGLPADIADGTYAAEFTVTFNPVTP